MPSPKRRQNIKSTETVKNGTQNKEKSAKNAKKNEGIMGTMIEMDEKYTSMMAVCANKDSKLSTMRPLMKLIEISCHGIPWLVISTLFLLSVHKAPHVEMLVNLLYGLILDLIVIATLKLVFRRSRPAHNEMDMFATVSIDNYSFPSGHASRAGMLGCFFMFHIVDTTKSTLLAVLWSLIVCSSRVILGRHHLVDVICGYIVGMLEYLLLVYLWIPTDTCMSWLELYFSHFHL